MLRFILRRLVLSLPVLVVVITSIFLLIHLIPGDPVVQMLGEGAAPLESAIGDAHGGGRLGSARVDDPGL